MYLFAWAGFWKTASAVRGLVVGASLLVPLGLDFDYRLGLYVENWYPHMGDAASKRFFSRGANTGFFQGVAKRIYFRECDSG